MNAIKSSLLALVRDAGGVTTGQGVVIGADPAALEALGETWRAAQGGQEGYYDYSVESVSLYNGATHGDYFALVAAMREDRITLQEAADRLEMLAFVDGRHQVHDLAKDIVEALDTPTGRAAGVYDRALEIVAGVLHRTGQGPIDVQALAEGAVDAMGDVFWDADSHPEEMLDCPSCEKEVKVGSVSCPHCGVVFDEPLSKEAAIREDAVACVVQAIEQVLQQSGRVRWEQQDLNLADPLCWYQTDFTVYAGQRKLIEVRIKPRKWPQAPRRTPRNKAAALNIFGPDGWCERWCVSLGRAASYLETLGLDPAPLYERAREKGWEVCDG